MEKYTINQMKLDGILIGCFGPTSFYTNNLLNIMINITSKRQDILF